MLATNQLLAKRLVLNRQLFDLLVGLLPDFLDVFKDCLQLAIRDSLPLVGAGLGGSERRTCGLSMRVLCNFSRRSTCISLLGVRLSLAHYIMFILRWFSPLLILQLLWPIELYKKDNVIPFKQPYPSLTFHAMQVNLAIEQ